MFRLPNSVFAMWRDSFEGELKGSVQVGWQSSPGLGGEATFIVPMVHQQWWGGVDVRKPTLPANAWKMVGGQAQYALSDPLAVRKVDSKHGCGSRGKNPKMDFANARHALSTSLQEQSWGFRHPTSTDFEHMLATSKTAWFFDCGVSSPKNASKNVRRLKIQVLQDLAHSKILVGVQGTNFLQGALPS